ncbi:hypothetical protein ACFV1L_10510 [Kitasatospora sp. NPDC059646]|uniref:hypothetical protein n=1 Tax=Kitasatospora sp. NPDC059646 TaxID=3346893 RepID=UPI003684DFF1
MQESTTVITADLVQSAQAGNSDAMWQIVSALEPQLASIVATVMGEFYRVPHHIPMREDLMQEARAALITVVAGYDTTGPAALMTRAYWPVVNAVTTAWLASRTGPSVSMASLLRIRRALGKARGDREYAFVLVNQHCEEQKKGRMSRDQFDHVLEAWWSVTVDLDEVLPGHSTTTIADTIPDTSTARATHLAEVRDLAEQALTSILPRRALVLRGTYGVGMPEMTDEELAGHLGNVGPSRVRGIRREALAQARTVLGAAA